MDTLYLNGEFILNSKATIPIMDRGFLFGDGVYEVIPVYANKPFRLTQHLTRLQKSLDAILLPYQVEESEWQQILNGLIEKNNHLGSEQSIYLQITRGVVSERKHVFTQNITPTILARTSKLITYPLAELAQGKRAMTTEDIRWEYCYIKAISLLANLLLAQEANQNGFDEAILIRDGEVTEGAMSNFFMIKNNIIITPPLSKHILGGITRELIIELAEKNNIPVKQKAITKQEIYTADEVWLTSSTKEIFPITQVDDKIIAEGKVGPMWHILIKLYHQFKEELRNA